MALKQLQVVIWAKSKLKWELLCEQHKQDTKENELTAAYNSEFGEIQAKAEKKIDKMMLQFQEDATK